MTLRSLNLASGSTMASPTPGVKKKFPSKGAWSGSSDRFGVEPRCLNFGNASTMASATPGLKIPPETDVVSVT